MDDNTFVLDPVDDVAIANWGSNWCMPSLEQIVELYNTDKTITEVATMNDVYGRKIISKKNGNSIFLPAGGYRNGSSLCNVGAGGYFWSCSLSSDNSKLAYSLISASGDIGRVDDNRFYGFSVRPVLFQK